MSVRNRQQNIRRLPPLTPAGSATQGSLAPHSKPPVSTVTNSTASSGLTKSSGHLSPNGHFSGSSSGQVMKGSSGLVMKSSAGHDKLTPPHMVVTGYPLAGGVNSNSHSQVSRSMSDNLISSYDLNPDVVSTYLNDNPDFLDKYVTTHVSSDTIERWLAKQTSTHKNRLKGALSSPASVSSDESYINNKANISKWKLSLPGDKRHLVQEMTKDIHTQQDRGHVLSELAACVAAAVDADSYCLYMINEHTKDVYAFKTNSTSRKCLTKMINKVGTGSTIASYVAATKDIVRTTDLNDSKHPEGTGDAGDSVSSVMAQPVLANTGEVIGVVQLNRQTGSPAFTEEEEERATSLIIWGSACVSYAEMYHCMTKQRKLNEFLLTVTKSIFQDIVSMDTVIMKIMNFAQRLVDADRASLFLLDSHSKELYARIFDVGNGLGNETIDVAHREIRFPMDKGVAGHVASTGEILNIPDAYADDRFNREVDLQTGYRTNTILCMPIYIRGNIIGVVQMVNKSQGTFTKADEESFETFAVYCGLALHHAKLYEKIRRSEQKYKVALEVLSYHSKAGEDEIDKLENMQLPEHIPRLTEYEFSPWAVTNDEKPLHVIYMFKELFSSSMSPNDKEPRYDISNLIKFTLTVRKNYRSVPYHNWAHAFSVAHAMYTIIKTSKNVFTPIEHEGHNIFKALSSEEYKQVLGDIKHCILATDLALFFGNRAKLKELVECKTFDWETKEHRLMLMANCMTASDLCSMYKPWDLQVQLVQVIMEEFWLQGDEEKDSGNTPIAMMDRDKADQLPSCQGDAEKRQGITPLAMMDRDKEDQLPQLEVGFLVGICLPCYELLAEILPETKPMVDGSKQNLKRWQELADQHKEMESKEKQDLSKDDTRTGEDANDNKQIDV